ncbi:methyltransferase domain-containing protein [Desulfovibrio sp. TomC]|uniref:methyltransferase domain-containing protein n=1 Tax=Desulfovibrio sp. TomC TaxID=1562888 RepID=UPI0005737D53|nr:methyltransferase domain-containing protein [Desulfovibrio sp. TomC]KHK01267.1 hypothetical protein NY78_3249 [Desulfovibrio sp. TomC]
MDFSIAILAQPNDVYWRAAEDVVYPLRDALSGMGYAVEILTRDLSDKSVNIIFGLQDVPDFPLNDIPPNSIIYNIEQITKGSKALQPHYIESLCNFTVWDYSERNIDILKRNFKATSIRHIPLGYVPEMVCLRDDYPKDIDVLFYGSMNKRRQSIIDALLERGLNAVAVGKIFGHERNFLIARSKIVLNMHYYTPGIFEEVRMGFLLANKKTIVCERNADTTVPPAFEDTCAFAPYEALVETITRLLAHPEHCAEQGARGQSCFTKRPYADILADAAREAAPRPSGRRSLPTRLNAGSGKDFKETDLNIDINPQWRPDILLDLSAPLSQGIVYATRRFGDVTLPAGHFREIIANDVLEHVPDAIATMTNFLTLLRVGGVLSLQVPYDLSYGAWQDPTHVRAFNEMSLKYYTDWAWYVGWRDYRFSVTGILYSFSESGKALYAQNKDIALLLRTPRAVDSMQVTLEKRACTDAEKREFDRHHRTFYK